MLQEETEEMAISQFRLATAAAIVDAGVGEMEAILTMATEVTCM